MTTPGQFGLRSQHLGCLPIIDFFLARMGLAEHLRTYLPAGDARLRLAPSAVIAVVLANIVAGHRPVYALGEWAAPFDPAVLGLAEGDAAALNDDRVGRMLDRLFDADRASLITETVLAVIREFGVEVTQLHNDSTTVTVTGAYPDADGRTRGAKATPAIVHGHNKDYRPASPEVRAPAVPGPRASAPGSRTRQASPGGRLLGFKDAAAYLGRTDRWLRRAVANRDVRHYTIGGLLAFDPADLDALMRGLREEVHR